MNEENLKPPAPATSPEATGSAVSHEGIWRCTADDDPEKEWESTTALDALIDAEEAIAAGALKVVIQRIGPPNTKLRHAGPDAQHKTDGQSGVA